MQNKSVNGNKAGIKQTILDEIAGLYELNMGLDTFFSRDLIDNLAAYSCLINREISVYISRPGAVVDVSIGDHASVSMPDMRLVRNEDGLCGVRCLHTHPKGSWRLSPVDVGTLKSMGLDCMASLGVKDGKPTFLQAGFLGEWDEETGHHAILYGPINPKRLPHKALMQELYLSADRLKGRVKRVEAQKERAVLVGLDTNRENGYTAIQSLEELKRLAETAGAKVVGQSLQKRREPDSSYYIGSGKVDELRLNGVASQGDIYIFDDELSPLQIRNLEEALLRPVIDRTALILDIFASRATSREGKLQVELAQMRYNLPRLLGRGVDLSRLGGGIGTRGPGEKKLEMDRRRIKARIHALEEDLKEISRQRDVRRLKREKSGIPLVALVGYTNAGKSTLLNALSNSDVLAKDMLFATLDPVVRHITLPNGTKALLSDTVGFINKLPHELIAAFQSTLEEVKKADLILHVIDSSCPFFDVQMKVVEDVLCELNAGDIPIINVYNQIDKQEASPAKKGKYAHISAKAGTGLIELKEQIEKSLTEGLVKITVNVPYNKFDVLNIIRNSGKIIKETHDESGANITALIEEKMLWKIKELIK